MPSENVLGWRAPRRSGSLSGMAPAESSDTRWRTVGVVVFCVAAFLLISMGGAIVAAPLTVPLMFVVVQRHPTTTFRAVGAALVGATVAEVAWVVTYLVASEAKPWIWLVPLAATAATIVAVVMASGRANLRAGRGRAMQG